MKTKGTTRAEIWIFVGFIAIACGTPSIDEVSTVEKLQNTIKTMESLLEKQQKRMLSGFDGMRKRVHVLEKIADKTRKEIQLNTNVVCPTLLSPLHGRVLGGKRKSSGDLAYFVCDHGYILRGNEERVCFNNGTWSGMSPACQSIFPVSEDQFIRNSDCLNRGAELRVCSCPVGFQLSEDQDRCTDIDECSNIVNGEKIMRIADCQYKCINQPGSYDCFCPPGYAVDGARRCTDKNECTTGVHNCTSIDQCVNTLGGFECVSTRCPRRYIRTGDKLCQKIPCKITDAGCRNLPFSIIYYNMAITPNLDLPAKLFRLTTESGTDRSITQFSVAPGKDSFYFISRRVDRNAGWLVLSKRPIGPAVLKVEFQAKERNRQGQRIATHVAKIGIYVSPYLY